MPMYTFYLSNQYGTSGSLEAFQLDHDGAAFAKAGSMLDQHQSCDHVDVREGERPVVARYREQPVIRPLDDKGAGTSRHPL